jgi:hypothetical protein
VFDILVAEAAAVLAHRQTDVVPARGVAGARVLSPERAHRRAALDADGHRAACVCVQQDSQPSKRLATCIAASCRAVSCRVDLTGGRTASGESRTTNEDRGGHPSHRGIIVGSLLGCRGYLQSCGWVSSMELRCLGVLKAVMLAVRLPYVLCWSTVTEYLGVRVMYKCTQGMYFVVCQACRKSSRGLHAGTKNGIFSQPCIIGTFRNKHFMGFHQSKCL